MTDKASPTGRATHEPSPDGLGLPVGIPDAFNPHIRITDFAPSYRQFRLCETLTPEAITKALGIEPILREPGGKVTMEWCFWAEVSWMNTPDVGHSSVSTCCKIWDYDQGESRWSAYGFPEAFVQLGLTPLFEKDHGSWRYKEEGNPTLTLLAKAIEARRAVPNGAVHESAAREGSPEGGSHD